MQLKKYYLLSNNNVYIFKPPWKPQEKPSAFFSKYICYFSVGQFASLVGSKFNDPIESRSLPESSPDSRHWKTEAHNNIMIPVMVKRQAMESRIRIEM